MLEHQQSKRVYVGQWASNGEFLFFSVFENNRSEEEVYGDASLEEIAGPGIEVDFIDECTYEWVKDKYVEVCEQQVAFHFADDLELQEWDDEEADDAYKFLEPAVGILDGNERGELRNKEDSDLYEAPSSMQGEWIFNIFDDVYSNG